MFRISLLVVILLCGACSTITPYQPAEAGRTHGYSDFQIDKNHFKVSFSGNSITSREQVEVNLLYRAAEITLQRGYDYFILLNKETDKQTSFINSGYYRPYYPGFYWDFYGSYHPFYDPYYSRGFYNPYWSSESREVIRYTVSADIALKLGKKKSDEENVYYARDILNNLRSKILIPKKK